MAQKTQASILRVATAALAAKTITALTAANPPVVTSAAHALAAGTIGIITGVAGMTDVNNRAFKLATPLTNTFELAGVDGSAYAAYSSGGSFTPQTMTAIGEVRSIGPGFDGEASEIDVTHLASKAKEYLLGLQDFGNVAVSLWVPSSADVGQAKLRSLKESAATCAFAIDLPSGQTACFMALVKSFSFEPIAVDGAFGANVNLRVTNAPAWFA